MKQKNTIMGEEMKTCIAQSLILLMQKKPYTVISIGEITAKAGVNRSTYYRNFDSKEGIVKFYLNEIHYEYCHFFNKNEPYRIHLEKLLTHFLKYKNEFMLIYKNGLAHLILETLDDFYTPLMKDKTISLEEQIKIFWYNGAIYNTFLRWVSNEMRETPKELSDIFEIILSSTSDYDFLKRPFLVNDEQLSNIG